ncbi:hypothetical protein [Lolliginicoccus suaedae]|uniref:hypothetical protein n=1 Tax=Lolliginicoccus suaedae TaxID=2605429 RepID=UPI0011F01A9D|nr:hypothetical protein [Lolliginicoccus suaedae]
MGEHLRIPATPVSRKPFFAQEGELHRADHTLPPVCPRDGNDATTTRTAYVISRPWSRSTTPDARVYSSFTEFWWTPHRAHTQRLIHAGDPSVAVITQAPLCAACARQWPWARALDLTTQLLMPLLFGIAGIWCLIQGTSEFPLNNWNASVFCISMALMFTAFLFYGRWRGRLFPAHATNNGSALVIQNPHPRFTTAYHDQLAEHGTVPAISMD